jgi:hypothetical protein
MREQKRIRVVEEDFHTESRGSTVKVISIKL